MSKYSLIVNTRPKEMKEWQDCQWRRQACDLDSCPICGRINRDREAHIKKGEDPDSMGSVIYDVSNNFKEMIGLLKKDAAKRGIDLNNLEDVKEPEPPLPTDYDIYNKLMEWRQGIYDIAEASEAASDAWLFSEAGKDLIWYSSTVIVKLYRQLGTVWQMENEEDHYLEFEYQYTGYVLGEVLGILSMALNELSTDGNAHAREFNLARLSFDALKQETQNY